MSIYARDASFLCVTLMNCLMSRISLGWKDPSEFEDEYDEKRDTRHRRES